MRILECLACGSTFHETDQTRSEQRDGLCPSCANENLVVRHPLKEVKPLEVDAFEIDIETLVNANWCGNGCRMAQGRHDVVAEVIKALDPDSKKRFEEYQEQNDPCR